MKEICIENNPLCSGMKFNTYKEIGEFLEFNDTNRISIITGRLKNYCIWHKENGQIIIDHAFEKVKSYRVRGYRYDIGQIINVSTGSYKIIKRRIDKDIVNIKRGTLTNIYTCKCLKDSYEFDLTESRIALGIGCPICGHRKVIPGVLSLYDEYPEFMEYVVDIEEAKHTTSKNSKKILCKCPICDNQKYVSVGNLVNHGFSCEFCSDHISYPNKFVRDFLKQLQIDYTPEVCFDWSDGKLYDQYIEGLNTIIENHGAQHYIDTPFFSTNLQSQKENDIYKYNIAINNGIKDYIILDCRKSNVEWIKNSIMQSSLPSLLNFSEHDIDWTHCHMMASTNSELEQICQEFNNNNNITRICEMFHHDPATIRQYLEVGAYVGLCNYKKHDNSNNGRTNTKYIKSKPIYCVEDDIYFMSKFECEKYYKSIGIDKFDGHNLYMFINSGKSYKNRHFKYITKSEFNQKKDESKYDFNILVYGEKYPDRYVVQNSECN